MREAGGCSLQDTSAGVVFQTEKLKLGGKKNTFTNTRGEMEEYTDRFFILGAARTHIHTHCAGAALLLSGITPENAGTSERGEIENLLTSVSLYRKIPTLL